MSRMWKCILSRSLMVSLFFFFFSIFLKKIKVDKGLVKFFKFLSLYFSLSLCFEGLLHPCGCKLPLFPPIFLGAAVYVIIYVIYLTCARAKGSASSSQSGRKRKSIQLKVVSPFNNKFIIYFLVKRQKKWSLR